MDGMWVKKGEEDQIIIYKSLSIFPSSSLGESKRERDRTCSSRYTADVI